MISTSGIIANHDGLGRVQRSVLEVEGVPVSTGAYGESRVEFGQSGWFPEHIVIVSDMDSDEEWGA